MSLALPSSAALEVSDQRCPSQIGLHPAPTNDEATRKEFLPRSLEALFLARNVLIGP
jgi:hypothetical protein